MRLVALKDPHIVDVGGKRGRAWTGRNEAGNICRVTIFEATGDTIEIEIEELKLPEFEVVSIKPSDVGELKL
jgi:hypothetical protein